MVLFHAADLFWATKIKQAGIAAAVPCRPVRDLDMLRARMEDSDVRALIVDLDAPEVALSLIRAARDLRPAPGDPSASRPDNPPITIVAYGPHVDAHRFEQARAHGADRVMPRGALDRNLPDVLASLNQVEP